MKKAYFLLVFALILALLLTGCTKEDQIGEKLCRIEIANATEQSDVSVLENQKQSDVTVFFDESNWTETTKTVNDLTPQYVISLYQEKTPTVIKSENGDPYIKIMEYVTFENSNIVKVSISGGVVNNTLTEEYLSEYYVGSEKFFSALTEVSQG
ncbi:MAG: hypothetical protein K2H23_05465 [Oscillospiraceae bacterium]|nr:hypothetical protein [Oscillospiraceae bacterium]